MSIHNIITELCESNSSNYKIGVLKKYKNNALLARVLKMTYDKVIYRYYLTMNHWYKTYGPKPFGEPEIVSYTFEEVLDFLEDKLSSREITGNAAIDAMDERLRKLAADDRDLIIKIINRDLRINCGRTHINKVFGDLITKPIYMRCSVFGPKTAKDIAYPAILQLKADGTYREMQVLNGSVEFMSRSGENYEYTFQNQFANLQEGHYTGELLVLGTKDRAESNGLLNSDNPPMDRIVYYVWDYITPEEYSNAAKKIKNTTKYKDRFAKLKQIVTEGGHEQIKVIESHEVNTPQEAFEKVVNWMNEGLEGGVLKDKDGVFRDGTSKHQLKMKLFFSIEVRILGFNPGTIGTKRENKVGSIIYSTDDGNIKGSVSGFSDSELDDMVKFPAKYINRIVEVEGNDLTIGRNNEYYAISHPRYIQIRNDKNSTDTLESAKISLESAKLFR